MHVGTNCDILIIVAPQVVLDPTKRLSADACLKHPWLSTTERRPSTDRPPTSPSFFVEALERIRGINADRFRAAKCTGTYATMQL